MLFHVAEFGVLYLVLLRAAWGVRFFKPTETNWVKRLLVTRVTFWFGLFFAYMFCFFAFLLFFLAD